MISSRQRIMVALLIAAGLVIVGFFGARTFHAFRDIRGHRPPPFPKFENMPAETDVELIRDWMTIGFVSHTYRLHPRTLYDALDIPPKGNEDKSLKQLNDEYFPGDPGHVLETVKTAVQANLPGPTATTSP